MVNAVYDFYNHIAIYEVIFLSLQLFAVERHLIYNQVLNSSDSFNRAAFHLRIMLVRYFKVKIL